MSRVVYKEITPPIKDCSMIPVLLNDKTMEERYEKVLKRMKEENYDSLVIYGDLEHGSNFEYLTGFLPRFEEALLILHIDGSVYMAMGNENLNKVSKSRLSAEAVHVPYFSLPNQPMETKKSFVELLKDAKIQENTKVGIVGWKNFTSSFEDNSKLFDVPYYIVQSIEMITKNIVNATYIFIGNKGVRCINNVNEIEHYEFGAALAGDNMLRAMDKLDVGVSEIEIANELNYGGQRNSVVTIAASGPRFVKANIYPTDKKVQLNDTISLTVGYKGGLSSRGGYAVHNEKELDENQRDYVDVVVKPYYEAYATWLENIHCGMSGKEMYDLIETILPKEKYHWHLCPGHLCADEEWMSSPIYENSEEILESGMLLQIDIIPSVSGYGGTSAESSIVLADEKLRREIEAQSPLMYDRIKKRREYIMNELNIKLHDDVLPLTSSVGYLRPYLLEKNKAMAIK
ncbi:MAG: M24 family metallopeptidase [Erysipelotrichaceae bacterium]|uniref:M24 family metallopeptidase n=1 Tax=Floccifex sp. TaxID=2815810 RepID=UPI002A748003|nr:M24 family metallopeptidase [Floccifex sp.]MDD7281922.1 M24 family metallopeptidase [Erysipelotrichaceae bacterium]MDY2958132.1 M24 family metallopeptidase [Floccifex sp.]